MWGSYWAAYYWSPRYWAKAGLDPAPGGGGGGTRLPLLGCG